jgi:hypothetical protein
MIRHKIHIFKTALTSTHKGKMLFMYCIFLYLYDKIAVKRFRM